MSNNYKPFGASPETEERSSNFVDDVKGQVESVGKDFFSQLLGLDKKSSDNGEINHVQASQHEAVSPQAKAAEGSVDSEKTNNLIEQVLFQLGVHQSSEKNSQSSIESRPAIDYKNEVMHAGERAERRMHNEVRQKIQEIKNELQQLISLTKELKVHFGSVAVEAPPQEPGKYHENFFEWLLIMIKQARQKVENSSAWLGAIQGKKKKGYWDKAKSHGTSYTQSGERSTVTSTG